MVLDDNRDAATVLAMFLRRNGFDAEAVHNSSDAIAVAERFQPDCLITDIGMPGMDGCKVARTFRAHLTLRHIALIALTAYEDNEQVRAAGFNHHLLKPAQGPDVIRLLRSLLPAV
jgi:CheY-like chemotaxis protein